MNVVGIGAVLLTLTACSWSAVWAWRYGRRGVWVVTLFAGLLAAGQLVAAANRAESDPGTLSFSVDIPSGIHLFSGLAALAGVASLSWLLRPRSAVDDALQLSEERYRGFVENSGEGIYLCEFDEPMPIDLPEDEQVIRLATGCYIAVCNDVFAKMYGFESSRKMIGMRAIELYGTHDNEANVAFLKSLILNNYRVADQVSEEFDADGNRVIFANNCLGIVEDGHLLRVWGTQRDITKQALDEQQLRLRDRAFATSTNGIVIVDATVEDLPVVYCNPAFEQLTGYAQDEILGRNCRFLQDNDRDQSGRQAIRKALANGHEVTTTLRNYHKNGRMYWAEIRISPVRDPDGRITHYLGFQNNITQRKQAEQELSDQIERTQTLLETSLDGYILADMDGRIVDVNPAYCKMVGYGQEQLANMNIRDVDAEPESVSSRIRSLQATQGGRFQTRHRHSDGHLVDLEVSLAFLVGDLQQPLAAAFVRDITQEKIAERQLRSSEESLRQLNAELEDRIARRTAELEEKNLELKSFAHSVSHDLRAPLRGLEGFARALAEDYRDQLGESADSYIDHILASTDRMDRLVSDLLAYSQLSHSEIRPQKVNLNDVLAEARAHLESEIQDRRAMIRVDDDLPTVQAHRATLIQVIANLLSNGIKFVAANVQPEIHVWADVSQRGTVRLWVGDNGIGISPENQERIFSVFERLHGVESYPGTGIGLAIVGRACERLSGRCGVESALGGGSRFWIELPAAGQPPDRQPVNPSSSASISFASRR